MSDSSPVTARRFEGGSFPALLALAPSHREGILPPFTSFPSSRPPPSEEVRLPPSPPVDSASGGGPIFRPTSSAAAATADLCDRGAGGAALALFVLTGLAVTSHLESLEAARRPFFFFHCFSNSTPTSSSSSSPPPRTLSVGARRAIRGENAICLRSEAH